MDEPERRDHHHHHHQRDEHQRLITAGHQRQRGPVVNDAAPPPTPTIECHQASRVGRHHDTATNRQPFVQDHSIRWQTGQLEQLPRRPRRQSKQDGGQVQHELVERSIYHQSTISPQLQESTQQ